MKNMKANPTLRNSTGKDNEATPPISPDSPLPLLPEKFFLSPLDGTATTTPRQQPGYHEIERPTKMDPRDGVDLRPMGRPPVYRREGHTTDEYYHQMRSSPQPGLATPALSEDGDLVRGGVALSDSRADLLSHERQHDEHQPAPNMASTPRSVSFAPPSKTFSYPSPVGRHPTYRSSSSWPSEPASWSFGCCGGAGVWQWHPSFSMYLCFVVGILFSVCHHLYYLYLDGRPAEDQTWMLRYGSFLAYAAKAGFSAAVISAYKQRVWVTVRNRFLSISALDALFAAGEDMMAMLNLGFLRGARGAYLLASFAWTTPFVVILTANTLLVEPRRMTYNTTCPGIRTLNFSFEETNEWRDPTAIDGLFENPVSLWNTTRRADDSDPGWFDYYTGPSSGFQQTTTLGAFLEEVVARKHAAAEVCGVGWNCSFTVNFTAPGYQCTELASGVGSVPRNLTQESGEAVPPFGTDLLLPQGDFSYLASTTAGEYSMRQLNYVNVGGVPLMDPPYPDHFGALRTEPLIWVGYTVINHPNQTQPTRDQPGWDDAFTPKIFACEHRETDYIANFTYIDVSLLLEYPCCRHRHGKEGERECVCLQQDEIK